MNAALVLRFKPDIKTIMIYIVIYIFLSCHQYGSFKVLFWMTGQYIYCIAVWSRLTMRLIRAHLNISCLHCAQWGSQCFAVLYTIILFHDLVLQHLCCNGIRESFWFYELIHHYISQDKLWQKDLWERSPSEQDKSDLPTPRLHNWCV